MAFKDKCPMSAALSTLINRTQVVLRTEFIENVDDWLESIIKFRRHMLSFNSEDLGVEISIKNVCAEDFEETNNVKEVVKFLKMIRVPYICCRFNIPKIRTRLEKLMGTNYVSLTDRDYMQKLQERILEDYEEQMDKRIRAREEEEMERVKNLVLVGKIPLDQAPPEMAHHPIMLIENHCNQLIAERRAKIKIYKVKIPTYLYWDDTPDPPSGLTIELGHVFRHQGEKLCHPVERHLESSEEDDLEASYMMPSEEYDKIKYESSLIKRLMACETVEEMYALADDIIGVLKTIDESARIHEETFSETQLHTV